MTHVAIHAAWHVCRHPGVENCENSLVLYSQLKKFSGELGKLLPELLRKFRNLRVKNQRVLSDLHAWAVRTISSVSNKNRLLIYLAVTGHENDR